MKDNTQLGREKLEKWQEDSRRNIYQTNDEFKHSIELYFPGRFPALDKELSDFGQRVVSELEPLVIENNLAGNLPRIEHYDGIGRKIEKIVHHPSYEAAGNIIYGTSLLKRMSRPGGLLEALAFMYLSSHAGEAGHNCPLACSAGIIRVFQKTADFEGKSEYLEKLLEPSYTKNFTGAQFLTEVQGGSDVGLNATEAYLEEGQWRIKGEKWFCSNADAELILMTARYDQALSGTKGLGLFLVPAKLENGERNRYSFRRLKQKIGTESMASAEIDFNGASATPIGKPSDGFKLVMENVLHLSRLFNTFCVLGMARRAYSIALAYARNRIAFGNPIIEYPLVKENLAKIKCENIALMASIFATVHLQDQFDTGQIEGEDIKLLLRLLANLNKYISALWSVEHIHHSLDVLAGNGAIESFSPIPRLLRDCIVCENWEGTHNVLRMQIMRDILKYAIDQIFIAHIKSLPASDLLKQAIEKLERKLKLFREQSPTIQSLQIKKIVDGMAVLYAAIQLEKESSSCSSKQACSNLFQALHFHKKFEYDEGYYDLVNEIFPAQFS